MTKANELPKYQQPREKLARYGVAKLADHELLAILLGTGFKGVNVIELSKRITKVIAENKDKGLTLEKLETVKGLGKVKASQVISVLELGRRMYGALPEKEFTPQVAFDECKDIRESKKEHFVVFYLDSRNAMIAREIVTVGVLDSSLVHAREVFEPALRHSAHSIVLAHNHPSGDPEPSQEDIEITKMLIHAGKLLDIRVVDHVIITKKDWKSLRLSVADSFF